MAKLQLLSIVVAISIPIVARAQPAPAAAGEAEIESASDCEHEPTCVAEEFADALASQPVDPQALRLASLITFEPGRARVYSSGREKIEALARSWRAHPRWATITVEGYSEAGGKVALAGQRASRVRGYLIRYGVPPEYVVAIGHDNVRGSTPVKRPIGGRVDLAIAVCDSTPEACRINRLPSAPVSIVK
jgi:outer membrane protein OmpA-like peptidoglycan-associated protein